jgi:ABC-2 type transport system ATP-binding protein
MNAAIQIEGLRKVFGSTTALNGVELTVPEGAIYALVGPNGAGKTTIIKLLLNILRPTAGQASVLGIDSRRLAGRAFNRIGYVSENQHLPDWMTAGVMLDYLRPFYPTWDRALEQQLIQLFDVPLKRKLKHLSRGMRMKAAFAASLAYRPSIIILDEPFSGLDPLVRDELIESLLERAPETTIFLSSHDLAEIESFSSHVGYLEQGSVMFSEDISFLSGRFREVTIAFDNTPVIPVGHPADWLQPEISGSVIRFIHSGYEGYATEQQVAQAFPAARSFAFDPMPLRSIFLAVAKSERNRTRRASANETARMVNA